MRLSELFKSASFRLGSAYVGLFSVSVAILAAVVYLSATTQMQADIRERLLTESTALHDEFKRGGIAQLLQAVTDRQRGRLVGGLDYTILDTQRRHLFGALPAAPCIRGWAIFTGPPDGDEPRGEMEELSVRITPLPGGYCLLVGDDTGKVRTFGSLILGSFGWVFLLTATLGVAGGSFLSSRVLRRIEAISRTAEAIIEGDLNRRVPRRRSPDDLDHLAATFNRMLDRVTSLMETLRHVSNDIAHDLRTPLGRLRNSLEEVNHATADTEEYRRVVERSIHEVDCILETFTAILRIAQIESGNRRSGFQRIAFDGLAREVCDTFAPAMDDAGKSLRTKIAPHLWIFGDRELLVQSMVNLLENAMLHTPQGTTVTISACMRSAHVEVEVSDDGCGVPTRMHGDIFRRFFRADESRSAKGNGLGLSIVAAVAELHGADLVASDNAPGLKVQLKFASAN